MKYNYKSYNYKGYCYSLHYNIIDSWVGTVYIDHKKHVIGTDYAKLTVKAACKRYINALVKKSKGNSIRIQWPQNNN